MNCPACKKPMVVLELNKIEVDYCLSCGGIWFDEGELELVLENAHEKDALLSSFHVEKASREKKRRCPICRKTMEKIHCGKDEKACLVDKCKHNHGIWFDHGELYDVIKRGNLDKQNKILSMLEDIFREKIKTHHKGGLV
jgi:uncharacterized protein